MSLCNWLEKCRLFNEIGLARTWQNFNFEFNRSKVLQFHGYKTEHLWYKVKKFNHNKVSQSYRRVYQPRPVSRPNSVLKQSPIQRHQKPNFGFKFDWPAWWIWLLNHRVCQWGRQQLDNASKHSNIISLSWHLEYFVFKFRCLYTYYIKHLNLIFVCR